VENLDEWTVILETKRAKLMKDRFIFQGQTYLLSEIKNASLKSGFLKLTALVLEFNDGKIKEFLLGKKESIGSLSDSSMVVYTQQWVTTINMLIAMAP
jgi:hypothetical protein